MYPSAYFPPTYFPSAYFSDPGNPGAPAPGTAGGGDRAAYAALIAALEHTEQFAAVAFATPVDTATIPADSLPLAVVLPGPWADRADFGSGGRLRGVNFTVTVVVRGMNARDSFEQADHLAEAVVGAINGADFGGGCLPTLTAIARGRPDFNAPFPELRVVLEGQFTYSIPAPA